MTKISSHFNGISRSCNSKMPGSLTCICADHPGDMLNPDEIMSKPPTLPGSSVATGKQGGIVGTGLFNG